MEANELVARLETRLKVITRIGQQARAKVLSERETKTTVNLDTMSGPIGKLIGPAKARLQRYVEEASSLPSSTVEEKIVSRGSNCSY